MGPLNRVAEGAWLKASLDCCQNLVSLYLPFCSTFFSFKVNVLGLSKQVIVALLIKQGVIASSMTSDVKH